MVEKYSPVLPETIKLRDENSSMEGPLGIPPTIILESSVDKDENDENTPVVALTERINLLEIELGKVDPLDEDFDVILADIASARIERDNLLKQMQQKEISEKKSALFSAAGRKGSFVRQLNRLRKIMDEGTIDKGSEEYISIAERRKSLEEKLRSASNRLQESRNVYASTKNISEQEYGAGTILKLLFESNKDQASNEAFLISASKEADTPEKKAQLDSLIEGQNNSKKALSEIQNGRRISLFEKISLRIKNKIDQSPKLQSLITVAKYTAVLAPIGLVAGSVFANFIFNSTVNKTQEPPVPQIENFIKNYKLSGDENKPAYTVADRPTINDPVAKESVKNNSDNISLAKDDLPEKYLTDNVEPYPVDMSQTRLADTDTKTSITVDKPIVSETPIGDSETISVEPNNHPNEVEEDLKSKLFEKVAEIGLNPEIIKQMSEDDFIKFNDIYETKKLGAIIGGDPLRDALADYLMETL